MLGDIIQKVNDVQVSDYNELRDELEKYQVGESVTLNVLRDDRLVSINVLLEAVE